MYVNKLIIETEWERMKKITFSFLFIRRASSFFPLISSITESPLLQKEINFATHNCNRVL